MDGDQQQSASSPGTAPAAHEAPPSAVKGTPPAKGASPSAPAVFSPSKEPDNDQLRERLKDDILSKGGTWDDGWQVESKMRASGSTAGTWDSYYRSPGGKRFRSRNEAMKSLGFGEDKSKEKKSPSKAPGKATPKPKEERLSHEQALARAKAEAAESPLPLPLKLGNGVKVLKLGTLNPKPAYHTETQLWPVEYWARASIPNDPTHSYLLSKVKDGGDAGPCFSVSTKLPYGSSAEETVILTNTRHPDDAWRALAQLQHAAREALSDAPKQAKASHASRAEPTENGTGEAGPAAGKETAKDPPQELRQLTIAEQLAAAAARSIQGRSAVPTATSSGSAGQTQSGKASGTHGKSLLLPNGHSMPDSVKEWLVSLPELDGLWGMERFGLADIRVCKALEGLEGADQCTSYKFVEERSTWAAEKARLEKLIQSRTKQASTGAAKKAGKEMTKQEKQQAREKAQMEKAAGKDGKKRARDESKSGKAKPKDGPAAKKCDLVKEGPTAQRGDAAEDILAMLNSGESVHKVPLTLEGGVARVMKKLLDQVDKWAEKQEAAKERREAKQREKQQMKPTDNQTAPSAEFLARQEQAREEERKYGVEDSRLPGASALPPVASPVGAGILPATALSGIVELWAFASQFQDALQLQSVPSIAEMEQAFANPDQPKSATTAALMQIAAQVAGEVFNAALTVASERDADIQVRELKGAFPPIKEDTWQEVVRRLFLLAGTSAFVASGEGSGGLDIALGPNVGCSPLGLLGPAAILQGLLAGPSTEDPRKTPAALPLGASSSATEALLARLDGCVHAGAGRLLQEAGNADGQPAAETPDQDAHVLRACRRILLQLTMLKAARDTSDAPSSLCFEGGKAAAAARSARPLDLMIIANRVDAGYYAAISQEPMDAFKADVTAALENYRVASTRKGAEFAASLSEKRASELADMALGTLESLIEKHKVAVAECAKRDAATANADSSAANSQEQGIAAETDNDRTERTIVDDLSRPFVPWDGCAACWKNEDHKNILLCDGCDLEYHYYCMQPPLSDIPTADSWYCPRCVEVGKTSNQEGTQGRFSQPHPDVQRSEYQQAALLLGSREFSSLSAVQRVETARLLVELAMQSLLMRDMLQDEYDLRREQRRELLELRMKFKRKHQEQVEREKALKEAKAKADGNGGQAKASMNAVKELLREESKRTRAREAEQAESLRERERERQLVEETQLDPGRCEHLGYDRHWNRYWLFGAWDGPGKGAVYVERRPASAPKEDRAPAEPLMFSSQGILQAEEPALEPGTAPWGVYSSGQSVDSLIAYLNPQGQRESVLKRALQRVRPYIAQSTEPEQQQQPPLSSKGAAVFEVALKQDGALSHAGVDTKAADTTDLAAANGDGADALAIDSSGAEPMEVDGHAEVTASLTEQDDKAADASMEVPALDQHTAAVRKLAGEVMAFEEGLSVDALSTGGPTWPHERRRRWRFLLETTTRLPDIMAALVIVESAIKPAYLKPSWRLWAFPAPNPALAGTLASVRLRLAALRSAYKRFPSASAHLPALAPKEAAPAPGSRRARLPRGALAEAAIAASGNASEESEPEPEQLPPTRKITRQERAKLTMSDEAYALKLQAELNGERPARERSRMAPKAPQRATRAARRPNGRVRYTYSDDDEDSEDDSMPRRNTRSRTNLTVSMNGRGSAPVDTMRRTRAAGPVHDTSEDSGPPKTRAAAGRNRHVIIDDDDEDASSDLE